MILKKANKALDTFHLSKYVSGSTLQDRKNWFCVRLLLFLLCDV